MNNLCNNCWPITPMDSHIWQYVCECVHSTTQYTRKKHPRSSLLLMMQ